ncbi:MAG: hypothetical protein MK085_10920 [Phycisphaerales bacterium]|nr:hypothetical protein [Phycisphaerales bacterium]
MSRRVPGRLGVGITALAFGVIGLVGLVVSVAWLLGVDVPSIIPGVQADPDLVRNDTPLVAAAALFNGAMSVLLTVFGLGLLRNWNRDRVLQVGRIWAWTMLPFALFGGWVGWHNMLAADARMREPATDMLLASSDTARMTAIMGIVFGAALSWGVAFALLAWIRFARSHGVRT